MPITDSNVDVGDYPWRSFEEELDECQAYYEKSFAATAPAQNAATTNTIGFAQALGASTTVRAVDDTIQATEARNAYCYLLQPVGGKCADSQSYRQHRLDF